jgi:hypothetical protein
VHLLLEFAIGNKMPPPDRTMTSFPYFDYLAEDVYGRAVWAEVQVHF